MSEILASTPRVSVPGQAQSARPRPSARQVQTWTARIWAGVGQGLVVEDAHEDVVRRVHVLGAGEPFVRKIAQRVGGVALARARRPSLARGGHPPVTGRAEEEGCRGGARGRAERTW